MLSLAFIFNLSSQITYVEASSYWDDSFSDWILTAYNQDETVQEVVLRISWPNRANRWDEWTLEHEDYFTKISRKWANDLTKWELRSPNGVINFQTRWRNDYTEWKISHYDQTLIWKSRYKTNLDHWQFSSEDYGNFEMITFYENDIRDWQIIDETKNLEQEYKEVMIFISLFISAPRQ